MRKLYLFTFLLSLAIGVQAQDSVCQMTEYVSYASNYASNYSACGQPQSVDWDFYSDLNSYIPDMNTNKPLHATPIKTIPININIVQKNDGSGNFQNTPETIARFRTIVDYINQFYTAFDPSDPISWVTPLPQNDSRIRFSLGDTGHERIYFYQNDYWWGYRYAAVKMEEFFEANQPERLEQINVYILGEEAGSVKWAFATMPSWTNFNENMRVTAFHWDTPVADYASAITIAHEFGHNLGLWHTYYGGGANANCNQQHRDFLKDVFLVEKPSTSNCPHDCNWSADAYSVNGDGITNNLMGGNKHSGYISPMQAGMMHRSLAISSARKYVQSEKAAIPLVIRHAQTWDFSIQLYRDIIIEEGASLTISCELLMHPDAKILVKKRGQLIVNGGTISCSNPKKFWQGIAVIGTQNQPATPTYQGAVRLINGATIANARCGVQLYLRQDDGEPMMSTSNGILIADNANFINNIIGVDAAFCAKSHAVISRSHFVIDEDYYNKINRQPYMVKLYEASNLIVNNNIFENKYINNTSFDNNKLPVGVKAYNSALRIINGNTFKNLRYGIHAYETTMNSVSEISNNNFDKNITGIYMSDVHTPQIFFNTFTIEPFNADWSDILRLSGIYLDGVIGHSVEENTFNGLILSRQKTIGLLVNNGGAQDVEVYKNEFTQLNYAILAQNNNRSADGLSGLCVKCNTFTDNQNDVSVSTSNLFTHAKDGIAINQGSPTAPAANLFTAGTYPQLQWNIYNLPGLDKCINYYVPRNTMAYYEFNPSKTHNVRRIKSITEFTINNCSSHHPIVIGGDTSKLLTKERMQAAWQKADSSQTVLAARTDEGNTTALQSDVSTTNTDEAYAMRNRLLNVAPYTSTTVLKEVVEQENTINNALVRDVLVANPQAAKSEAVMTAVESKSQPMSDYMLAEIEAGQNSISAKEQLEAKATLNRTSYTDALHDLIYLHLADTNNVYAQDNMIALLHGSQHLYDTYLLADVYLQMQDAQQTRTCLAQLPNRFVLSEAQQAEYNALMDYYNWRIALINANRSLKAIDSNELNQLQAWYNNAEQALLQTKALNALRIADAISYQEPYVLPDETGTPEPMTPISLDQTGKTNIQSAMDMRLYPNPASAYVVVEYKLSRAAAAFIRITASGTGKTLWQQSVNKAQDAMVIDLEAMAAGHYIVQLYVDNVLTESETLSIAK